MTCRHAGNLLSPYLEGELHPRRAAALEAHLAGCARCRAELGHLRRAVTALGTPPPSVVPVGLLAEFKARLAAETASTTRRVRPGLLPRLLVPASAVAAVLLVGVIVYHTSFKRPRVTGPPAPTAAAPTQMAKVPRSEPLPKEGRVEPLEAKERATPSAPEVSESLQGVTAQAAAKPPVEEALGPAVSPTEEGRRGRLRAEGVREGGGRFPALPGDAAADRPLAPRRPRAAPTAGAVPKPRRLLLPPGVEDPTVEPPRRKPSAPQIARTPEAVPGTARAPAASPPPAAPVPQATGEGEGTPRAIGGWVAIRVVPREEAVPSTPPAPPASGEGSLQVARDASGATAFPAAEPRRSARRAAPPAGPATVSPALFASMRREVDVVVQDVPLAELVARLSHSSGVAIALSGAVPDNLRVHAEFRGVRLWEALQKLADAADLIVAPQGAGVALRPAGPAEAKQVPRSVWSREWGTAPATGFAPVPTVPRRLE